MFRRWIIIKIFSIVAVTLCHAGSYEVPFFIKPEMLINTPPLGATMLKYVNIKTKRILYGKSEISKENEKLDAAVKVTKSIDTTLQITEILRASLADFLNQIINYCKNLKNDAQSDLWEYLKLYTGVKEASELGLKTADVFVELFTKTDNSPAEPLARMAMVLATLYQHHENMARAIEIILNSFLQQLLAPDMVSYLFQKYNLDKYSSVTNHIIKRFKIFDKVYYFFIQEVFNNQKWNLFRMDTQDVGLLSLARGVQLLFGFSGDKENDIAYAVQQSFLSSKDDKIVKFHGKFEAIKKLYEQSYSANKSKSFTEVIILPAIRNLSQHIACMLPHEFFDFYSKLSQIKHSQWLYLFSGQGLAATSDQIQNDFNTLIRVIKLAIDLYKDKVAAQILYLSENAPNWFDNKFVNVKK